MSFRKTIRDGAAQIWRESNWLVRGTFLVIAAAIVYSIGEAIFG